MEYKNREYDTLKLRRGERRNDELRKLSESNKDFDYRRLYVKERELDLHVFFSRKFIGNVAGWSFLALAVCYFQYPFLALTMFGLSLAAKIYSEYNHQMYSKVNWIYTNCLRIVDSAIEKEYGISMS